MLNANRLRKLPKLWDGAVSIIQLTDVGKGGECNCGQRHILRDRRPSTAACQACWAMATKELK
jgi:hypothetical protein